MRLTIQYFSLCGLLMLLSSAAHAQNSISLGVSLIAPDWSGNNGAGRSHFKSDRGGQFGMSISYSRDRLYAGLSLQGGEYQFDKAGPDQFSSSATLASDNIKVDHSDFDLLLGYYFWRRVSLFVDLKAVGREWLNNDYEQGFSGVGFGVAAYHPINASWTLYGSWGFVGGTIEQGDNTELGDAHSQALTFATNYKLGKNDQLSFGFRSRNYLFDYDDGAEQDYSINGLFAGYNHVFAF